MRRLLLALAITLLPTLAIAHGHGGGGGHVGGGGHFGGSVGHAGGSWAGHVGAPMTAGARVSGWSGRTPSWNGQAGNWHNFHHGHFVRRHGRVFVVGGPWWGAYNYYDYGCWQWLPTRWGPRRVWVCGDYY